MRLWPRSLVGQTLLVVAIALLVAQFISVALLARSAEQRREAALLNTAAFTVLAGASPTREDRRRLRRDMPRNAELPRGAALPPRLRYREAERSPIRPGEATDSGRAEALATLLASRGIAVEELVATSRPALNDPLIARLSERRPRLRERIARDEPVLFVVGLRRENTASWEVIRVVEPRGNPRALGVIIFQTLILFAVLMLLLYLALRRITRPLAQLTERTDRFARSQEIPEPLRPRGPDDVQRLIAAHNAMEARIGAMLEEKDVMLGAIGHDLKTPLAALRVRIESVEDDVQRGRMAQTIEEITHTLDDILWLARIGRATEQAETTDLAVLAATVVAEFEDIGREVELAEGEAVTAPVRPIWLKRALRNLVGNAVRYAGNARVSVLAQGDRAILRVEDDGPGIPAERLAEMLEPFARGDPSRNRATGGAGLGLTLARAIAEQHGGELVLENRTEGGLRAEIRLPR